MAYSALHSKLFYPPDDKAVPEKQKISLQSGRWVSMNCLNIKQLSHRWLGSFHPSLVWSM